MSEYLLDHDDLGSIEQLHYVIKALRGAGESQRLTDIRSYCIDQYLRIAYSIDGILSVLQFLSFIQVDDGLLEHTQEIVDVDLSSVEVFRSDLVRRFLDKLLKEGLLGQVLAPSQFKFDITTQQIAIHGSAIPLRFAGIRNFLQRAEVLKPHEQVPGLLLVAEEYSDYFENELLPKLHIEASTKPTGRQLSLDELHAILQLKERYGAEAERFVLDYERKRLEGHGQIEKVRIISHIEVSAGYDIISFDSIHSKEIDRHIEVKSYSGHMGFYWSKNEVRTAKEKRGSYFLYLVDRNKNESLDYAPIILQDPYPKVFESNDWQLEAQSWHVSPLDIAA